MGLNSILILVVGVVLLLFYYFRKKFNYFAERGIPFVKPVIPFGNLYGVSTKFNQSTMMQQCYNEMKGKAPVGGVFFFTAPVYLPMDLDLLKHIFIKDFQYFHDRGMYVNERDDPLSAHLFSLEGATWKNLRAKLSPTFTSGKMKLMFPTMIDVSEQFRSHLLDLAPTKTELEMKELLAQFTTDIIGNVAFGIECNSMKDPTNEFRSVGRKTFEVTPMDIMKVFFLTMFHDMGRKLRMMMNKPEVAKFFFKLLKETVQYREENNIKRNDFLSLLLQIKNTGKLDGETADLGTMTFEELAAQVFLFFIAGFETSSSTMTFSLYELAMNPEIQTKARQEIEDVLQRHNGQWTYQAALELEYLDQVINETLRKYPVVDGLLRKVKMNYQVPNSKIVLEKDKTVIIPVFAIQRDPANYPDPLKFDPDRFTKENVAARHPCAFIPFGEGPRNCIGLRFGMMQTRIGLAQILRNFEITPSAQTLIPMRFKKSANILSPDGGMFLNLEKLAAK